MRMRRMLAGLIGAGALIGGAFAVAQPASADQVWYQSVGRASAQASCNIPANPHDAAGWSPWTPSWAEWDNGRHGGYVCNRELDWANDAPPPLVGVYYGCQRITFGTYIQFGYDWSVGIGSNFSMTYSDASCTTVWVADMVPGRFVYATSADEAATRCTAIWPGLVPTLAYVGWNAYSCAGA